MEQQVKAPKYEFEGHGFSNKREYNNAIAISFLSDEGKDKLISLSGKAIMNIMNKLDLPTEKASKLIHIGYRNTQQKTLNQNLQDTADSLTEKGYVELNIFTYGPGGSVISNAREILLRKDFNEKGQLIIADKMLNPNEKPEVKEVEEVKEEVTATTDNHNPNLIISEDIDSED